MAHRIDRVKTALGALAVSLLMTVVGCGGEDGGGVGSLISSVANPPPGGTSATGSDPVTDPVTVTENRVTGSVGDGPIVGARIKVRGNSGALLMETESSATADYDLTIKTQGKNYAVTIEADEGIDLVTNMAPDFALAASITKPNARTISNLNPFTTLIVGAARKSGTGLDDSSLAAARDAVMARYTFGLDANVIPDPTGTPIDSSNVHHIVKTSETMGEMVRRTRDALAVSGATIDGNVVMDRLAADLTDGWIDGQGATGADARTAAVANVASAAVLLQAMANRLHVYGVDATGAMDNAIRKVRPETPAGNNTSSVSIPAAALEQAVRGLYAAKALSADPRIDETIVFLQGVEPGALPADVAAALPADLDTVLEVATLDAAYADDAQLSAINAAGRGEFETSTSPEPEPTEPTEPTDPEPAPTPEPDPDPAPEPDPDPTPAPANNPPTISGTPGTNAEVGTAWSFQPTASDPDGDALTFSVSNKPAWLSFDSNTGRLSGTPSSSNVGTHLHIIISVTDGTDSASLPAFDLVVSAPPPPPNQAPVISGMPSTTTVLVGEAWSFTPSASDPDGDALTFSVSGAPTWMSLDSATGRLSGTPPTGSAGRYENIVITVSDGEAMASLAAFTLTVNEPPPIMGSATVNWTPPTERIDGSAIGTIASYRIYYGRDPALDQSVSVSAGITSYVIENLDQGTWYFAVTVTTSDGLESAKSATASKTID